ncbi:ABC transporter ATP-binding protein [Aestuariivirga litoralis]|uniref:ABC transporter ATP-binding protein n=1 Tax=Aestuariivirga litoralis TaxID=2650924 RepID=UPI0018C47AAC|nr:ABC transporter ATP-binding protein [Aestuariivirga litoralis]MBG1233890.1 ABC transporter ATP-binding protein [Aestuariivirga litoralis]
MAQLKLDHVTKKFGKHAALKDVSLDIADGEFFVLLGPTGAGKSTTLRTIAGLEKLDSGSIHIGGNDVVDETAAERDVALVFQYYSLYPRYTVRENLAFPLRSRVRRLPEDQIAKRIADAAKTLRIEHLLDRKTDRLSGGEMQRVSIGRAIVREPRAFLMDEPLSNLDAKLREALRGELKNLQARLKSTFLFVTHDQVEAMSMGDRIGVMQDGQIVQVGTPHEIYNAPNSLFVAGFVGAPSMSFIPAVANGGKISALGSDLKLKLHKDTRKGALTLGLRAEDVVIGPKGVLSGTIHEVENYGVEKIVTLKNDGQFLRAATAASLSTPLGAKVKFGFKPGKVHCFDPESGLRLKLEG